MVIGPRFAWAHLPKTGGDLTARVFQLFPEIVTYVDDTSTQDKHLAFFQRPEVLDGRLLAMNIRRLPAWTVSVFLHRAQNGRHPDYVAEPVAPADEMATTDYPDELIGQFAGNGIDRWFRQESLVDDVLAFIGELTTVDDDRRSEVAAFGRVNEMDYDHDVSKWLDPEQVRTLYRTNPIWAAAEEQVYGSLLIPSAS
jgi:hypothetical protein